MGGQCVTSAVPTGLKIFYIVQLPSSELLGYYQSSLGTENTCRLAWNNEGTNRRLVASGRREGLFPAFPDSLSLPGSRG